MMKKKTKKHLQFFANFNEERKVWPQACLGGKERKTLCHFRFHSTALSSHVPGLDFKAPLVPGRKKQNKTKTNICFVVYCVLIGQRDEMQTET